MKLHAKYLCAGMALHAQAQQFDTLVFGNDYPGISEPCKEALNITLTGCPSLLATVAIDFPRLNSAQISQLCTTDCRSSLTKVQEIIAAGCGDRANTIIADGTVWPATMVIDRFAFTYDLSCRKDSDTGVYCDEIFLSWLNDSSRASIQNCSDCTLGVAQIQLNSPFTHNEKFAESFASITSSCGKTQYPFTSPPAYAISSSTTNVANKVATSLPCSDAYEVQTGDTCDSVAIAKNVSTYAVIQAGTLDPECNNIHTGLSLCLPEPCKLHQVAYNDTCASILAAHADIDGLQLALWNPNLNSLCSNIFTLVGTFICVSVPGALRPIASSTIQAVPNATDLAPIPTNAVQNSTSRCAVWYTIQEGDYCEAISIRNGISLKDFYFLNPQLNSGCVNLWLGSAYCVQAVGDIKRYADYPVASEVYSLTPASYRTITSTPTPLIPAIVTSIVPLPTASGTFENCAKYVDHIFVPPFAEQAEAQQASTWSERQNSCDFVSAMFDVSLEDFLSWNPSLAFDVPCALQSGLRYCGRNVTEELHYDDPFDPGNETIDSNATVEVDWSHGLYKLRY